MAYDPGRKILERYADILVNFAIGKGKGIKSGDAVNVVAHESSKPLYAAVLRAITRAGGHAISRYMPDNDRSFNIEKDFYSNAEEHQLRFFPAKYWKGLLEEMDHSIFIESEADAGALRDIDPKKIMMSRGAMKPYREWRDLKENRGRFSWTIALYGTKAMASEAGLGEKEYWDQIIKACFLDSADSVGEWRRTVSKINAVKRRLDRMPIERLRVAGPDADLLIELGEKRIWEGGRGANIPSFEIFTSPDWRGTEGWIRFDQPVYANGNMMKGVELRFKKGRVVYSGAKAGQKYLREYVKAENADKIGEFSMTDRRLSRITKFMATTLYDENIGGPNGNMHIALGSSYHDCYKGDPSKPGKAEWARMGFNSSPVHQDFISTSPRTVTARLKSGKEKVIYKNGMFAF